ncbi:MAG: MnmC family methyltransferase [SAR324 cluster bacterium]|nr:MnmC family methyltransferase [SAR324 cluster bacterium]
MAYRLKRQSSGALALHNSANGETMHPVWGPWEEATRLYVQGSGLENLLAARPGQGDREEAVLFDVGLGAAANALAALECHARLRRRGPVRPLHLISFENDLEPLRFALAHAGQLGYLLGHEPCLEALAAEGRWSGAHGQSWELRLGDFPRLIREEPRRADLVFFDPFSPRANPDMWSVATLEGIFRCRRPGGAMRLVTYSSAFSTRAALLLAGFHVGAGIALDGRRRATEAATNFSSLAEPLDLRWLNRWKRERDPWPCLTVPDRRRQARQALLDHSQWSQFAQGPRPERAEHAMAKSARKRNLLPRREQARRRARQGKAATESR